MINAAIQKAFARVSMNWLIKKVMELHKQGDCGSVANPSLTEICEIVSESLKSVTPTLQSRAFEHCLLTLPPDGHLDDERGSKNTIELLRKHNECLVPTSENAFELFPEEKRSSSAVKEGAMTAIWDSLVSCENPPRRLDFSWPYPVRNLPKAPFKISPAVRKNKKR